MATQTTTPVAFQGEEEEVSGFDIREWLFRILDHWYLFVIGAILAMAVSYLSNRKWIAQYLTSGTIIIKESNSANNMAANAAYMTGFAVDAGYRNVNNQVIMLAGYDLISRVVDSLQYMQVEYITQGRFKTRNLYDMSPIQLVDFSISDAAYGVMYRVDINEDGSINIESTDENKPLDIQTHFGERIENGWFSGILMPTAQLRTGQLYFRFRTKSSLVDEFASRLQLDFVTEGSTVLRLSLVSETPNRDADFINKLSDVFLLQNLERKNAVADNSIRFISEQLDLLRESLSASQSAMNDYRTQNSFINFDNYASSIMKKIETYDQQEMELRLKETYLDYLTKYLKTNLEEGTIVAPSSLGLNEPSLLALVNQLNTLQMQRAELSEKNVFYQKYTSDIDNIKNAINEVVRAMRMSLDIEKADLQHRTENIEKDMLRLPQKELQMVALERDYRINDSYYTYFLQRHAEAQIQKTSNVPDNEILDRARTISVTNGSQKKKTTTKNLTIGLLLPLLLIVLSELLNNRIRTPKEAERIQKDFALIGTLKHTKTQTPTIPQQHPRSSYAEMLRSLRTRIEFVLQRKSSMVLTITSTQSGDGKSYLATNLASLYAMTGKRVLLIDLDIRKPNVHDKLGIVMEKGITDYLVGDCTLESILHTQLPYKFDLILAGTIPPNPGELIRSERLSALLLQMKQTYDFIIIDTSPVGQVPDATALIEQSDLTLFLIRCMKTEKNFCKSTLQQLALDYHDKIRIVLSDVPAEPNKYGKYYSHYSAYKYSYHYGYGAYGSYGKGYGYGRRRGGYYNYYSEDEV